MLCDRHRLQFAMKKRILWIALAIAALAAFSQCTTTTNSTTSTNTKSSARVARIWRGEVLASRADEYEQYLKSEGVSKLRGIPGNLGVETFRRNLGEREEFLVISYWPSEDSIRAWAGDDVTSTRLMPRDREYLIEPELRVRHYNIR